VNLVKSKARMADHGEVFTPPEIVDAMLDLVKGESERVDSRFLEPACGSGNFLVPILRRKLATVHARYGQSDFEWRSQALLALMSIYGIELLDDNVAECRQNLLDVFAADLGIAEGDSYHTAAKTVLTANIVHGDALSMTTRGATSQPIAFAEWSYLGKGRFHRRDFRFDTMAQMSSFRDEDTLFGDPGKHEVFTPTKSYGTLSVADIAGRGSADD
jgi:N-6 DNA Methylase